MSYKLLLIDDERFMISYLKSCIPWNELDVEIVDSAQNGADAIEKVHLHQPDLVITDIVMPNMSGLEFIKNIYNQFKSTKIIILSGHQNFTFAKEALSYGVVDYIVKPSLPSDILTAVQKAISCIEQERQIAQNHQTALSQLRHSMPDIQKSFLNLLIQEPTPSLRQEIAEKGKILGFPLADCYFLCIKIIFDNSLSRDFSKSQTQELQKINHCLLSLPSVERVLLSRDQANTYVGICSLLESDSQPILNMLQETVLQLPVTMQITICISSVFDTIEHASHAFKQVRRTLNSRPCSRQSRCFQQGDPMYSNNDVPQLLSGEAYLSALRSLSAEECEKQIHIWIDTSIARNLSMYRLRRDLRSLLKDLDNLLFSLKTGLSFVLLELGLTESTLQQEESLPRLEHMLNLLSRKIISLLSNYDAMKYPPMVFLCCQYIEEHYREKISVSDLAEQLFLSPNYLSSLFKKHIGSSISEYITLCRIQKAKELMAESNDLKTYELASLVGYSDYEHFRKVFKKYVGMNPAKYRSEIVLPK